MSTVPAVGPLPAHRHRATGRPFPLKLIGLLLASAALVAGILAVLVFWVGGGRWMTVATPSMGETAPVGTLILSKPIAPQDIHVGSFIVFHPPTDPAETYSHRVVSIEGSAIRTRGDINGAMDPWTLHSSDVVGGVTTRLWGVGWFLKMVPILVIGGFTVYFLASIYAAINYRLVVRTVGFSLVFSLALWVVKPLVRAVLMSQQAINSVATTILVPTGLLPLHAQAVNGNSANLRPGQVGAVVSSTPNAKGQFEVILSPHLTLVTWIIFAAVWILPLVICLVVALRKVAVPAPDEHLAAAELSLG